MSIRTACPYCGVGCGVLATPQEDGSVAIAGDVDHPANYGRLCSKGSALGETLSLEGRLLEPHIHGQPASWEDALNAVAQGFSQTIAKHGADSVALYVSGQLLTEDYYVANKLVKGFFGTGNIDTNSRLCMASSVAGHRRAFGADTVPGCYTDLETADCVVLVGSNLAWCHPVLFQRLLAAREKNGTRLIVVDPRRSASAEAADLHLAIKPDADVALFLGLLNHLQNGGCTNDSYKIYINEMEQALHVAEPFTLARTALETELSEADVAAFFTTFATHEKVVTIYSQGVNQSVIGTDKVNAIINCHLLTGRIGRGGMGPFSITGQPNAMGGREVGGLANMLAAHMNIEDEAARSRVQRFWQSPRIAQKPGLKAVEMFEAVRDGRIKAIWIISTNPVDSLPQADGVQEALRACPFVVVQDAAQNTDTARFAHILLPATAWGEKEGTVTNSERVISRQRAFLPASRQAKPDWWIIAEVARRMGYTGFDYASPAVIFREHAALSGFENGGTRDFDISAYAEISDAEYATLSPFQWPQAAGEGHKTTRFFRDGGFFTPDGKARAIATPFAIPGKALSLNYPLTLNTGRIRDQWHTMTRTGKTPRLMGHLGEPFCDLHPTDAEALGIRPASIVRLDSAHGTALLRVRITPDVARGSLFVPMHWSDQFASKARINALVNAACDPVSGQPGLKRTPARATPFAAAWYGFAVSRKKPDLMKPDAQEIAYWALSPCEGGYRMELADEKPITDAQVFVSRLLQVQADAEWIGYHDAASGNTRLAAFRGEELLGAVFLAREPVALARGFIADALVTPHPGAARYRLLAGQGGADRPDPGPMVCACWGVGRNEITAAIAAGAGSVDAVGVACKAGTNCGSCRSDIARMLPSALPQAAE